MSVGTAKPDDSAAMSSATTFSYAQAAKGQSVAQTSPSPQPNSTQTQTPSASTKPNQDAASTTKSEANPSSVAPSSTSNASESVRPASVASTQIGQTNSDTDPKRSDEESIATAKTSSAPSISSSQGIERSRPDSAANVEHTRDRSSTLNSRAQDPNNDARRKKGKKSKAAEKDGDEEQSQDVKETMPQPQPELTEAPIPKVNIWQQRKEAQAAKAKTAPSPTTQSRPAAAANAGALASNADQKPRAALNDAAPSNAGTSKPVLNGSKPSRKGSEQVQAQARNNNDQTYRRPAPRGSRANEKETKPAVDTLPSVGNPASWPTPETAAVEVKSQTQAEKSDKDEKEDPALGKPRQKWVQIPFVPSVSFNTPLPTRGGPRGGGRAGTTRGGREGTSRGHQNNGVPSQANGTTDSQATSVAPPTSKRTTAVDTATARESRKPTVPVESPKHAGNTNHTKPEVQKPSRTDSVEASTSQQPTVQHTHVDRHPENAPKPSGVKDANTQAAQETTYPIQNGGSHRSNERSRGSGRGRGGHANSGLPHQAPSTFSMNAAGYNYQGGNSSRPSQYNPSYPQVPYGATYQTPSPGGHRGRPGSISAGRSQSNGGRHGGGRMPTMPPVTMPYDASIYSQQTPFNYFETNFLALVQTQIEYYFSIDNLCKDMFLRKHMDSQGLVFLNTIAQFRRMLELTHDINLIRAASQNSREVELITGEDGLDRIRRREGWQTWVQPMHLRDPSAQNDGPKALHLNNHYPVYGGYPTDSPAVFSPNGASPHFVPYMNGSHMVSPPMASGTNGHVESHLSATVPEFSPSGFQGNATSERTGSSREQDASTIKKNGNMGKKHAALKGDSSVHQQPNGIARGTYGTGDSWRESNQAAANGINGGHKAEQN